MLEKEIVLDVSRRLRKLLEAKNLEVILTRDADRFVPLEVRTARANDARGDLFVSIHANAAKARQARGIETYFVSLESSDAASRQPLPMGTGLGRIRIHFVWSVGDRESLRLAT